MCDAIGPNARDKAKRRPEKIVGPTQPLHHRVGVNHTPARLAQGKLLRAHQSPFELGPEAAQGWAPLRGLAPLEELARARDTSGDLRPPRTSGHADLPV